MRLPGRRPAPVARVEAVGSADWRVVYSDGTARVYRAGMLPEPAVAVLLHDVQQLDTTIPREES